MMGAMQTLGAVFRASIENPVVDLNNPDHWEEYFGASPSKSGVRVNRKSALGYAAFWRGVNLISRDMGKLPLVLYKRKGEGKEKDTKHPAFRLLRRKPNSEMTAFVFRQTLMGHALIEGNGYAYIFRKGSGDPTELIPLDPTVTYPVREGGKLWYVTTVRMEQRKLNPADVLHIKGLSFDGLIGYSVLEVARESLGLGVALRDYGSRFFSGNAEPGVILEHPKTLSAEAAKRLKASWDAMHAGLDNAHKTAVLEDGMTAKPLTIKAKEAQLLESRQFEVREIANWFGVPPSKLGDSQQRAYASLEQDSQQYLDEGLDPWCVNWEEECSEKLLTEREKEEDSHVIEFMRQALVRADMAARYNAYSIGINNGILSPNECRAKENMNPRKGGDEFIVASNAGNPGGNPNAKPIGAPGKAKPEAKPEEDEEDEDGSNRAVAVVATERDGHKTAQNGRFLDEPHKRVVAEAVGRMVTRLGVHARKAAKKSESFDEWLDGFEAEHLEVVRAAIAPGVEACATVADSVAGPDDIVRRVFERVRGELDGAYSSEGEKTFAANVSARMSALEKNLPGEIAATLVMEAQ